MSFAKPKDKRNSTSKEKIVSPQRGASGKKLIQQNYHNRLVLNPYNKQQTPQIFQHKRNHSPNYSPLSKTHTLFTQSRDHIQSPREYNRNTYQMSNCKLNQSSYHTDRIDKIEENLSRVCYTLDTILPLLNLLDTNQSKNVNGVGGVMSTSCSTGNLLQKNESIYNLCKKLTDHESKLQQQEKIVQSLKENIDRQEQNHTFQNHFQSRNFYLGGKDNMHQEVMNVIKQLKLEEKISDIECNVANELEKLKLDRNKIQEQIPFDQQLQQFQKQLSEIQAQQESNRLQNDSQFTKLQNNILTISNVQLTTSRQKQGDRDFETMQYLNDQINQINEELNEFKEFRLFCWKEMDNLWRNIGHLFCEVEIRNKYDIQQKIDSQIQDIPLTLSLNERTLKVSIVEYFNLIGSVDKFNYQNSQRIMNSIKDYNLQIDKLLKQQQQNYMSFSVKEMEMYQQDIDTLEDRFINMKFQIEGTKQKMIFEFKKIEDKQEQVEETKLNLLKTENLNKESIKQDLTIVEHLKQKIQNLMDDVSKNIKQISDDSDSVIYRLTNELKRGVANLERGKAASGFFYKSIRGSEENNSSKSLRKYTLGSHDEIVYQPYTKNQFFIQLQAIQTDYSDEIKEL